MSFSSSSAPSPSPNSSDDAAPAQARPEGAEHGVASAGRTLPISKVERQLGRQLRRTCEQYDLLAEGDRIMVAVSGGKDSYGLLHLLKELKKRTPFSFELLAVHLDQAQPGYDGRPLHQFLERTNVPFEIVREDTYSVVMEHVGEGGTYCSLCSRLRRGILYRVAEHFGCNKIALGHHRDDALETFLMNLFYSGKLQSMPPKYLTDDGRFEVIRPLIQCEEEKLRLLAEERAFPILPCNLCGSQDGLKRDRMAELLETLEREHPNIRSVMMAALANVCPTHLLDADVQRAWQERDPSIQAKASLGAGKAHRSPLEGSARNEDGSSSVRRLPLLS